MREKECKMEGAHEREREREYERGREERLQVHNFLQCVNEVKG